MDLLQCPFLDLWIRGFPDASRAPQGMSLQQWTHSEHGLSEACSLHALKGIGEALHYIHSLNVVHSNVPRPIAANRPFCNSAVVWSFSNFPGAKKGEPREHFYQD